MPPEFNPSPGHPDWGWWIVFYFFIGGVTGGAYFAGAWLDLFGSRLDRPAMRLAHRIAFPLILVCAALLIVDLGRPERFWHMVFRSEQFPVPIFKPWSPMSLGSQVLGIFGLISFISFVDSFLGRRAVDARDRLADGGVLHREGNPLGKIVSVVGAVSGLVFAGYTGLLLNVTNLHVWQDSTWISALFVFSGISTGLATMVLAARRVPHSTIEKLEEADNYMMGLELVVLILFLATLGAVGARFIFGNPPVLVLYLVVVVLGLLAPLLLHLRPALAGGVRTASTVAAVLVLVGGFVLRWAVLAGPQGIGL